MEKEYLTSLLKLSGHEVSVTLVQDSLNWLYSKKPAFKPKSEVCIPLNEIITVQQGNAKQQSKTINAPSNQFTVYHVLRKSCKRWTLQAVTFTAPDAQVSHSWVQSIREKVQQTGQQSRPKKLLVFINPYGGRGKASKIYYSEVNPLFQLAGIECNVIETTRANHARDHLLEDNIQQYDGVVCVGGDGMFSELLHGLVNRTQSDSGICEDKEDAKLTPCSLRIGIIPAGSTDCVCFATMGINDPVTSALHIIIGDTQPMDVCASYHDGQLMRYSVSLIGYGFFGDVLRTSESMRWVGPMRYDLAGIRMVLSNRSYHGTVHFLEANESNSSPRDNTRCRTGCLVCSESSDRLREMVSAKTENKASESWKTVTGSFAALNITGMSSACPKSQDGLSPTAHLADGTADLIMVRECNTLQFLRHLSRHTNGKDQFAFPNVEVHRIRALRFIPKQLDEEEIIRRHKRRFFCPCGEESSSSTWNCDGEILDCAELSIRVHHQLIQLFARGIEDTPCR
ncbi:ceramide kinase-like [Hyperolius riggenbachi]|uniref:ceramide kinase-like n=1 Tax=Hyperolius riggenbachi TaxID=752182 RepID=UPI0035A270CD